MVWQECDAAERFEEFYDAAVNHGPQTVSRGGVEVAVLFSAEAWNGLKARAQNAGKITASQERR